MTRALALCLLLALSSARAEEPAQAADPTVQLRVVRGQRPGFWEGARSAVLQTARRLWRRQEPSAARGTALLDAGDPEGAVQAYDDAEKALPKGGPAEAALAHDRATALLHLGPKEAARALEESHRALEGDAEVRALGAYDAALALESVGDAEQAIAAYGRALALDPGDEDAKVNLELLLREEERKKRQPQAGKPDPKEQQKQGQQANDQGQPKSPQAGGEPQGGGGPQGPRPQGQQPGKSPNDQPQGAGSRAQADAKPPPPPPPPPPPSMPSPPEADGPKGSSPAPGQAAQAPGEQPGDAGGQGVQPLDRSEAQRLLDALRASEKNLQTWRFGKRVRDSQRGQAEKDW